ncbi:peptidoglycan-binding protein [Catellatospora sp. KI3]|uniref:peptidoglycan-binding protein n=1 Tax=Catellatospora sp. KI3 TaxID=3041620 RepID=UPI0032B1B56B
MGALTCRMLQSFAIQTLFCVPRRLWKGRYGGNGHSVGADQVRNARGCSPRGFAEVGRSERHRATDCPDRGGARGTARQRRHPGRGTDSRRVDLNPSGGIASTARLRVEHPQRGLLGHAGQYHGSAGRHLQNSLNICYGQRLQVDGVRGSKTFNAVAVAQRTERVRGVDGIYGPDTAVSIRHQNIYNPTAAWCAYQ